MPTEANVQDVCEIKAMVRRQFASLSWRADKPAAWQSFSDDFHPTASLYPASRPSQRQMVEGVLERMKALAASELTDFDEQALGILVHVFGNVAAVVASCKITENQTKVSRGVEMLLLIKDEGKWRIVSQAWDVESEAETIPAYLLHDA